MKILGIDTTRKLAKVLVYNDNNDTKLVVNMGDGVKHSEGLFLYIEKALMETKLDISDFDVFSAVVGPGSFTGIRVGMATIKGFNQALKKKIVPVTAFDILAEKVKKGVVLLNSTATTCYYGVYSAGKITDAGVIDKGDIVNKFDGKTVYILAEEQNTISLEYNNIEIIDNMDEYYFGAILKRLDNNEDFVPYYLQLSQAERNIKND